MMRPDEYAMWRERERTGKNVEELEKSYDSLIRKIKRVDPLTIVETADAAYQGEGVPRVVIQFLHSWFVLDLLPYRVRAEHAGLDTLPLKVLVLHHMLAAADNQGTAVRVMGQWIDSRSLQHGAVLGAHFARSTTDALARFFTLTRERQVASAMKWGGKPLEGIGDDGFLFKFFPRLPVALIHWRGDDEFPSSGKILYDVSASNYMPTHGLTALTEFLVHRLVDAP
ncbi:MAG: DUF3786 domain-containing protein [Desulfomonilaceae bacterium]|nr:DUF3786 domain-containing protein [Desulfomonilaceae bacterium]